MIRTLKQLVVLLPLASFITGCGGGEGGPSVSNLSATTPHYSQAMTVTVFGRSLAEGIDMTVDGPCGPVTRVTGGTDDAVQFSCTVTGLGELVPRVRNGNQRELASVRVPQAGAPQVTFAVIQGTRSGTFVVELDPAKAPLSVDNFLAYVNANFYTNVIFHRVIDNFVVQSGGYVTGPTAKPPTRSAIKNEASNGLKNLRGTIAMARTTDPDSATSQFFINVADNPGLDFGSTDNPAGYAVFGRVVQGQDVVDEIKIVPTTIFSSAFLNLPVSDVRIVAARQNQ